MISNTNNNPEHTDNENKVVTNGITKAISSAAYAIMTNQVPHLFMATAHTMAPLPPQLLWTIPVQTTGLEQKPADESSTV